MPKRADERASEKDVLRSFKTSGADGASRILLLEDAFAEKVGAALDVSLHKEPSEDLDAGGRATAPDELAMRRAHTAIGSKFVQPRDGEAPITIATQRKVTDHADVCYLPLVGLPIFVVTHL
jgi:hypothetical protein